MARTKSEGKKRPKDTQAGDTIRRLRINEGLSRVDLTRAVAQKGVASGYDLQRVSLSEDLLYLIEAKGHIPGPRIKFALAHYFDLRPGQIWKADSLNLLVAA